jgi:glutamate dehydrogenase/leucine dehydrogenase
VYAASAAAQELGLRMDGASAAVQGYGKVGRAAVEAFSAQGARVVAVSDVRGGVAHPNGIDPAALAVWVGDHGTVAGFPGGTPVSNAALLETACDVLVPAATENQITGENADRIRARILAEGANGPTTGAGADILARRDDVFVLPDILCNGGGVIVSYLEMCQSAQLEQFTFEQVDGKLRARMEQTFRAVLAFSREQEVDMRTAAHMLAVRRAADAIVARGFQP